GGLGFRRGLFRSMYVNKPVIKDIQIEGAQLLIDYLSHNDLSQIPQVIDFNVVK
ncbi:hypothetical protein LLE75_12450, partial [Staphylococcus epidermidis]|nr:hypothetical protein [Staphylococcus epidermidis]